MYLYIHKYNKGKSNCMDSTKFISTHALATFFFLLFSTPSLLPFLQNAFILVQRRTTTQTAKPNQKSKGEEGSREGHEILGQGKQRRKGENAL